MMVQCKQCLAAIDLPPGTDPHSRTWCGCCKIDHHHGEATAACAADPGHECWQGPQAGPKPPECKVCRPIVHFANSQMTLVSDAPLPPDLSPSGISGGSLMTDA